jgi:hypothetical protein
MALRTNRRNWRSIGKADIVIDGRSGAQDSDALLRTAWTDTHPVTPAVGHGPERT